MRKGLMILATIATLGTTVAIAAPVSANPYDRGYHHDRYDRHNRWDRHDHRDWRRDRIRREREWRYRHRHHDRGYHGYYGR